MLKNKRYLIHNNNNRAKISDITNVLLFYFDFAGIHIIYKNNESYDNGIEVLGLEWFINKPKTIS